ncbi:MAG: nucleotidyltransferase family protein [Bryobacteraceae bacterium]|nr:nucleotidyltransferase family protein [Bryobacteraceae bacterium]
MVRRSPGRHELLEKQLSSLITLPALILAGGLGTRLRAVVPDQQKVLAQVGTRPFITYVLDQLADAGFQTAVLCTGHLAGQLEESLGDQYRSIRLRYSREQAPLGTAGAIRLALSYVGPAGSFVLNGDSHCRVDLAALAASHRQQGAAATIALARMEETSRFGRVDLAAGDAIASFEEKAATSGPGWVNAGIYLLNRDVIESIPENTPASLERDVFPKLIGRGLFGFRSAGQLWDIGVPDEYERAQTEFQPR